MRTVTNRPPVVEADTEIRRIEDAEGYIASICFKTGPPTAIGAQLEHTVHLADHPTRPLDIAQLSAALGDHAPPTLAPRSPYLPLRHGGLLTVGPGCQVGIVSRPRPSLDRLHAALNDELDQVAVLLARAGLEFGGTGIDPHRAPRRVLSSPRYHAMAASFARRGSDGRTMMYSTAGLQPCLDAGTARGLPARWAAVHELGPTLLATFANSDRFAGRDTGWASTRMRTWYGIDPKRAGTVPTGDDPASAWARYALRAPLVCVRRATGTWNVPAGLTFADWITGKLSSRPSYDDLDYHLGTLFPPVRPRGHLEVRYLDTQPGPHWFAPVAILSALLADDATVDAARDLSAPAAGRWVEAARYGLTDPVISATAPAVLDLALHALDRDGLPAPLLDEVVTHVAHQFRSVLLPVSAPRLQ